MSEAKLVSQPTWHTSSLPLLFELFKPGADNLGKSMLNIRYYVVLYTKLYYVQGVRFHEVDKRLLKISGHQHWLPDLIVVVLL